MPCARSCAPFLSILLISFLAAGCTESGTANSRNLPLDEVPNASDSDRADLERETPAGELATQIAPSFAGVPEAVAVLQESAAEGDNDQLRAVTIWLTSQGSAAVEPLAAVMNDQGAAVGVRLAACRVLGSLDEAARESLCAAVSSDSSHVRLKAIASLGGLRPVEEETVELLIAQLESDDEMILREAIRALGNIGPPAAVSVERMQTMYNDTSLNDTIRGQAFESLKKIDARRGLQNVGRP